MMAALVERSEEEEGGQKLASLSQDPKREEVEVKEEEAVVQVKCARGSGGFFKDQKEQAARNGICHRGRATSSASGKRADRHSLVAHPGGVGTWLLN
ncbi:hypothetical protein HYQ46_005279 [Verticillium longisporum]|nr:hypothetical protein HYQ46_005279 [Verticillium longisporum]